MRPFRLCLMSVCDQRELLMVVLPVHFVGLLLFKHKYNYEAFDFDDELPTAVSSFATAAALF